MKLRRPSRFQENEPALPLINIVFLLLIFFMIAGVLAESPPFPVSPPGFEEKGAEGETKNLRLYVSAEGAFALGSEELPRAAVLERLEATEAAPAPLDIVADKEADAAVLVTLMRELREAGQHELRLIVQEGAG
jgi:biopolymer transport protein ExbD